MDCPDGIRVFWNGSTLTTSHHQPILAPWYKYRLPSLPFEAFLRPAGNPLSPDQIQLIAFDAPLKFSTDFEERQNMLRARTLRIDFSLTLKISVITRW